jgi:hypothetical protein
VTTPECAKDGDEDDAGARRAAGQQAEEEAGRRHGTIRQECALLADPAPERDHHEQRQAEHHQNALAGQPGVEGRADDDARQGGQRQSPDLAPVDVMAESEDAAAIGEQGRDAKHGHGRLGADGRHQRERQQQPGTVARDAGDDGNHGSHRPDQQIGRERDAEDVFCQKSGQRPTRLA